MADLWIRTQNGCGLLKVDNVICCRTRIFTNKSDAGITIDLGKYDTEERSKEILDEIQFMLTPRVYVKTLKGADIIEQYDNSKLLSIGDIPTYNTNDIVPINAAIIYEMPEK